ncbi:MAG: glycosyltransferase, partial [Dehalococcoidia bacterium]|nr:glycosyltransferase [Dehalococcoidia bacterium]
MREVQLSIVIPTFNESDRIIGTLDNLKGYLESRDFVWEIILSDDGSLDDTVALVESWSAVNLNVQDETMR